MKKWWKNFLEVGPGDHETEAWLDSLSKPQRDAFLWLVPEIASLDRSRSNDGLAFNTWCLENGYPDTYMPPYYAINPDGTEGEFLPLYRRLNSRWHAGG